MHSLWWPSPPCSIGFSRAGRCSMPCISLWSQSRQLVTAISLRRQFLERFLRFSIFLLESESSRQPWQHWPEPSSATTPQMEQGAEDHRRNRKENGRLSIDMLKNDLLISYIFTALMARSKIGLHRSFPSLIATCLSVLLLLLGGLESATPFIFVSASAAAMLE